MRNFYVYGYVRLDTNSYFYIGKGHGNRYLRLDNRKPHFLNIVNITDVAVEILYDNLTEQEAFELERDVIEDLVFNEGYSIDIPNFSCERCSDNLVNLTWGGDGTSGYSIKQSEETIRNRANKNRGKVRNDVQRSNISNGIKQSMKNNPEKFQHIKCGTRTGVVLSEETRNKISNSHKGKTMSKEAIDKIKRSWDNKSDLDKKLINSQRSETMSNYRRNNSPYTVSITYLDGTLIYKAITIRELAKYMYENGLANTYNGARASINECTKSNKVYRKQYKIIKEFTCND